MSKTVSTCLCSFVVIHLLPLGSSVAHLLPTNRNDGSARMQTVADGKRCNQNVTIDADFFEKVSEKLAFAVCFGRVRLTKCDS